MVVNEDKDHLEITFFDDDDDLCGTSVLRRLKRHEDLSMNLEKRQFSFTQQ